MGALSAAANVLSAGLRLTVAITGMAACLLIVAAAFMRYVLSVDFYGSEELIMLAAFWLYFAGAALATREDSHITADLITSLIKSPRRLKAIRLAQHAISLGVSALALVWSWQYIAWSYAKHPKTPVLKFPVILMQSPILIFFVLATVYLAGHVIKDVRAFGRRSEP